MTDSRGGRDDWIEPGLNEVAPGVYRTALPLPNDGLRAVNVYLLVAADGAVLIDSGWSIPEARDLLIAALDTLGMTPGDIRRFLVTHVHRDHYTQAVAIRREFGTRVALGADERPTLDHIMSSSHKPLDQQLDSLRQLGAASLADLLATHLNAMSPRDHHDWELPDEWLTPGPLVTEVGRTLDVVATPGHTRGHVVFYDDAGQLLFAGDHVLPTITPSIGFEPVLAANPLGDFLASLAVVRARPDAMLLPAHGPVAASAHARVDELMAHHGARLDEVERALANGATTGFETAQQLKWTRRLRSLADLDPFNQMLAVSETGAHLQLLAAQGRVSVQEDSLGVRRYEHTQ